VKVVNFFYSSLTVMQQKARMLVLSLFILSPVGIFKKGQEGSLAGSQMLYQPEIGATTFSIPGLFARLSLPVSIAVTLRDAVFYVMLNVVTLSVVAPK
jgi:hypothetical protein